MNEEFIFSNLSEIAEEKNNISESYESGKWRVAEFKTGKCSGNMLVCPQKEYPDDVTLKLNLTGVYRIYICIPKLRSENYLYVKLSDDLCFTGVRAVSDGARPIEWCNESHFEEIYWKTAELTGKSIIIGKPDSKFLSVSGIAWIRCVKVSESELSEKITNKCIQTHFDEDAFAEDVMKTDDDYLIRLCQLKNSNAEIASFEFSFDYDKMQDSPTPRLLAEDERWDRGFYAGASDKETIYKKAVSFAHENGIEIYATNRMEVGNFIMPYTRHSWNLGFVEAHPEYYIKNRNNTTTKICSYAYEDVQDYVIKNFVEMLKYGFDGVSLICHRGAFLGFEEPVIKRFREIYPDINPCLLPLDDERLSGVRSGFMNEFMFKLRRELDKFSEKHIKINVITDYGLKTSKSTGLDVEFWAKEGLINSASQADMEIFEDLTDCMSDENPEFIDLEKYNRELTKRAVVTRKFATNVEKVCAHIPEYKRLKDLYGIDVYHVLPWAHAKRPEEYDGVIEVMKAAGAEKFLSWNTNHLIWDLPEWYVVSRIGNKRDDSFEKRIFHRVLSIDGCDVSQFNPNWRG